MIFRITDLVFCPECSHQKHPAKFPVINAKTGQRSPNCVDCPPHVGEGGLYVQSVPKAQEPHTARANSLHRYYHSGIKRRTR